MARFVIFAILLVVQCASSFPDIVLRVPEGSNFTLKADTKAKVKSCGIATPTHVYRYTPYDQNVTDAIRVIYPHKTCSVEVQTGNIKYVGYWTIDSYNNEGKVEMFNYRVYTMKKTEVLPTDEVYVYEREYVYAKIDTHMKLVTNCTATAPNGTVIQIPGKYRHDFHKYGDCGFYALINKNYNGLWSLQALTTDSIAYVGDVRIKVLKDKTDPGRIEVITLERGVRGEMHPRINTEVTFCQLIDSYGERTKFMVGSCNHSLPVVTSRHKGIWIATYGALGKLRPQYQYFKVIVYDRKAIESTVTFKFNEAQLLCRASNIEHKKFAFCHFIRPDGYVLNMSPGLGVDSYSVFNISKPNVNDTDIYCGLEIHGPKVYDYGNWKCGIGMTNGDYVASIVNFNRYTFHKYVEVDAESIYVKKEDSYEIKCTANATLDYCWFRSPNGTAYSVSQKSGQPFSLPYVGTGLSLGECSAKVDKASSSDQGEWTCNVGVTNGREERTKFVVNVEDSYIIADYKEVILGVLYPTTLSCSLLPNLVNSNIRYCHWIRPDGYGIYNTEEIEYETRISTTRCSLAIRGAFKNADVGRWTCVAGLDGLNVVESSSTIYVHSKSFNVYPYILVGVAAAGFFIAAIVGFCFVLSRRKRRIVAKVPPTQNPQPSAPPPTTLNPEYVSEEFRY